MNTIQGVIKTLRDPSIVAGNRFYQSGFYTKAMETLEALSLELCLSQSDSEDCDDLVTPLCVEFDDSMESQLGDDSNGLMTDFFFKLKADVMKYGARLEKKPSCFVKLFVFDLRRFIAQKKGDAETANWCTNQIENLF